MGLQLISQHKDTKVANVVDVSTYSIKSHCGENEDIDACNWKKNIKFHCIAVKYTIDVSYLHKNSPNRKKKVQPMQKKAWRDSSRTAYWLTWLVELSTGWLGSGWTVDWLTWLWPNCTLGDLTLLLNCLLSDLNLVELSIWWLESNWSFYRMIR